MRNVSSLMKVGSCALAALLMLGAYAPSAAESIPIEAKEAGAPLTGDPAAGKKIFIRCTACHALEEGVNKIGPSLHGIIGRPAGTVPKFQYTAANKNSGIVWNEQAIYDYLRNPQQTVKGTKMAFAGIPKPQERADLIAFLKQASTK